MASISDQALGETDGVETLHIEDLESSQAEEVEDEGTVSPRELTHINFRSLIGHTDEVSKNIYNTLKYFSTSSLLTAYHEWLNIPLLLSRVKQKLLVGLLSGGYVMPRAQFAYGMSKCYGQHQSEE